MNKAFAVMLAGTALLTGAVSCGKSSSSSSGGETNRTAPVNELSGDYLCLFNMTRPFLPIDGDIDDHISSALEYNEENSEPFVKERRLRFEEGNFRYSQVSSDPVSLVRSGTFSETDGKLSFSYEQLEITYKSGDTNTLDINDEPSSYDNNIVRGISDASDEEYNREVRKKLDSAYIDKLKELNSDGGYAERFSPDFCVEPESKKSSDNMFNCMPFIHSAVPRRASSDAFFGKRYCPLYHFGDILGFETYGLNVSGEYVQGEDFVLDFDQLAVYEEDPFAQHKSGSREGVSLNDISKQIRSDYELNASGGDISSAVSFSDGRWEWKNSEGSLINNGTYQESEKYPGLVVMYTDSSSKHDENSMGYQPGYLTLFLYISDNGEIFYPYFAKIS